ncbi:MAG: HNH endonuclease [Candidatus Parabeggiatoa sp. nov. 2]|nr:MAG: HNH endonuclease [Beggiatoa sp. 4572_84]RKZ52905.1 MAG: HNH endonuclease [Gammaproteobacteria bacterium]HEC84172.1 HNH endonuclease [Thioploca sp.]
MSKSHISTHLRQQVAEQSRDRCCYCQSQQRYIGILLTVEHIIPESLGGTTTLDNLCLACWDCNLIKGNRIAAIEPNTGTTVRLFHPNKQKWSEHFCWSDDGIYMIGITPIGRATVVALKLNRPVLLLHARRFWTEVGWHPPR